MKKRRMFKRLLAGVVSAALFVGIMPVSAFAQTDPSVSIAVTESGEQNLLPLQTTGETDMTPDVAESPIVGEDISRRGQNEKHFRKADGSFVQVSYNEPVHYQKDGQWEDIDNTLIEKKRADGTAYLINKAGDATVELPASSVQKQPVTIAHDGYTLSWIMNDQSAVMPSVKQPAELEQQWEEKEAAKVTAAVSTVTKQETIAAENQQKIQLKNRQSAVVYADMLPTADVRYDVHSGGLKESLILQQQPTQMSYTFHMTAPGLTASLQEDQSVLFCTQDSSLPVFTLTPPYMFDANHQISENISVTLSPTSTGWDYTITPDRDWLLDEARQYPVTIDPSVEVTDYTGITESVCVNSQYAGTGNGGVIQTWTGVGSIKEHPADSTSYEIRTYLKIGNYLPRINHCRILRARLALGYTTISPYDTYKPFQVEMYRVSEYWNKNSVTWDHQPAIAEMIDYAYADALHNTNYFDITRLIYSWGRDNTSYPNEGFMLKAKSLYNQENYIRYDKATDTNRPAILIDYRDTTGVEGYWTYTSLPSGYGGSTMVNNFSGNVVSMQPLLSVDGLRMPVSIGIIYNPYFANDLNFGESVTGDTFLGYGWKLNYQMFLLPSQVRSEYYPYVFVDGDGTAHYFYYQDGTTNSPLVDEDGLGYTLTVGTAAGAKYTIEDKQGGRMIFNSDGLLKQISDTNGNNIILTYGTGSNSKRLATIKDGAGRTYTLYYEDSSRPLVLTSMSDPSGQKAYFTYADTAKTQLAKVAIGNNQERIIRYLYHTKEFGQSLRSVYVPGEQETLISYSNKAPSGWYDDDMVYAIQNIRCDRTDGGSTTIVNGMDIVSDSSDLLARYTFQYLDNTTVIRDKTGRSNIYHFNHVGQTVQVQNVDTGTAVFYEYGMPGAENQEGTQNKILTSSKSQASYNNYALNHGFNTDLTSWSVSANQTGQSAQAVYDGTTGYFGKGCVKLSQQSGTAGEKWISQTISKIPTGNITVSCYVNTNGIELNGKGVELYLQMVNSNGTVSSYRWSKSAAIKKTDSGEWQRMCTTLRIEEGAKLHISAGFEDGTIGTVWLDDFQVEQGEAVSTYNLLENSYMKYNWTSWEPHITGGFSQMSSNAGEPDVLAFPGKTSSELSIDQKVIVSGVKGDVFSLSGYGKAFSLPQNNGSRSTAIPTFRLELIFYKNDVLLTDQAQYIDFNPYCLEWQYVSGRIIAPDDYNAVKVRLCYDYNYNNVYFKAIHLSKEEFGQTYVYDKNGNVTSAKDLANSESGFAYQNDLLTKMLNPTGSRYMYSYDEDTKNMKYALDADSGVLYQVTYDDDGNPTSTKTTPMKRAVSLSTDKTYMLVNAYSGSSVNRSSLSDGANIRNWRFDISKANQRWKLVSTDETSVYQIQPSTNSSLVITIDNNSIADNALVKLKTNDNSNAQKFKIVSNGDGTFRILTRISFYTKCIDSQPGDAINTDDGVTLKQYTYKTGDEAQKWYLMEFDDQNTDNCSLYTSSQATYTANGNLPSTQTDARGKTVAYSYNTSTGLLSSATDPKGTKIEYTYDANTRELTNVVAKAAGSSTILASANYTYTNSLLTKLNDYTLHYDGLNRYTGVSVGSRRLSTLSYNGYNQTSKIAYGNGAYLLNIVDTLGRINRIEKYRNATDSVPQEWRYKYNANGQLGLVEDYTYHTRTRYWYDDAGRITGFKTTDNESSDTGVLKYAGTYTYEDKTNRLKSYTQTFSDSETYTTSYRYGTARAGQIAEAVYGVSFAGTERLSHQYDSLGRRSANVIHTGSKNITSSFSYLSGSNANSTTSMLQSMTVNGVVWSYEYDDNGNIIKIYKNGTLEKEYTYDALNQMTKEVDHTIDYTSQYSYDNKGNITFMSGQGPGQYDTYLYRYEDSQWGDLMTGYDGTDITYDEMGNPLTYYSLHSFTWQNGRELRTYKWNGQTKGFYDYNENGIRVYKSVGGHINRFTLNGSTIIRENPVDNIYLTYLYDDAGLRYGFQYQNGSTIQYYYYLYNGQGDVTSIVDNTGATVAQYTYNAWGRHTSIRDGNGNAVFSTNTTHIANLNPFRYRGYYFDTESGFYYLNSRYYDSKTGRFINADACASTGQGLLGNNMFAYCGNNPVNRYDVGGMLWKELWEEAKAVINSVIHAGNNIAVSLGIDTAAIGAIFLCMSQDNSGIYHANADCWQQYFGYNDVYDFAFDIGTSMKPAKFPFTYNGQEYIFWVWKGDYINLGAGAEIGVYYGGGPHWLAAQDLDLSMAMSLDYNGQNIINYTTCDNQWWCTGFNPAYQNVNAGDLTATYIIRFYSPDLYSAFSNSPYSKSWNCIEPWYTATFIF